MLTVNMHVPPTPAPPPSDRPTGRPLGLALLALLLGACTTLLPPDEGGGADIPVPAGWAANPSEPPLGALAPAAWWQGFRDPLLLQLTRQAAQTNSSIRSAQATLRQAQALRDASAAALSPTLGFTASAQRNQSGFSSSGSSSSGNNSFRVGLDADYEPFAGRQGLEASEASARARAASLADAQVNIATEVGLAYIDLRSTQARLAIAQANLASQQQTLQIVRWRLQAGLVTQLDADQAAAAVAQTQAQLPPLQTRIDQGAHALAVLTGQPPAALLPVLQQAAPLPLPPAGLALSLPADTLRQRADVQAAEHDVAAAWQRVGQARADRLPSLRLGGSLGLNALTVGALGSSGALAAAVLASVSWPLFDGGAGLAQERVQGANFDNARIQYQATVLAALQEVEDTLVQLRDDSARLVQLQLAERAAASAALLARQRFSSGLVDFQVVLDTQRNELSTQDSVASAQAAISADHVRLFRALGGGWQ